MEAYLLVILVDVTFVVFKFKEMSYQNNHRFSLTFDNQKVSEYPVESIIGLCTVCARVFKRGINGMNCKETILTIS